MNKFCRICWNSASWRQPTGEASKLEKSSYVAEHGFGHEEWIFNFAWLQPGPKGTDGKFRYGFLQPIGKYRSKYEGHAFDIFLYTVEPGGRRLAVAEIENVYVPLESERKAAHAYMVGKGWIEEMKEDVTRLGFSPAQFAGPENVINVRFRMADVRFFESGYILPESHVSYSIDRYVPLNWTKANHLQLSDQVRLPLKGGKKRSEGERTRAAVKGVTYSPLHVKLQNELYDHLSALHGAHAVRYEKDWVDLQLHYGGKVTYFEIKTAISAKQCIREAIGQLLEYSSYPDKMRATTIVVVGQEAATAEDEQYLYHLQVQFSIPIRYMRWNWDVRTLEGQP